MRGIDFYELKFRVIFRIDEENACALGRLLNGGVGDAEGVGKIREADADSDELIREKRAVLVVEQGAHFERARGEVDLVIGGEKFAAREDGFLVAGEGFDGDFRVRFSRGKSAQLVGELLLWEGKDHRNRIDLSEGDETCGVGAADEIADVHLAEADATGKRRVNFGEIELKLGGIDGTLIGGDGGFELFDERNLGIDLLLGDRVLGEERLVADEVFFRVFEQGAVAILLSDGGLDGDEKRFGINFREELIFFDHLSFLEMDGFKHARDLAADGDELERGDGARDDGPDGEILWGDGDGADGLRGGVGAA